MTIRGLPPAMLTTGSIRRVSYGLFVAMPAAHTQGLPHYCSDESLHPAGAFSDTEVKHYGLTPSIVLAHRQNNLLSHN